MNNRFNLFGPSPIPGCSSQKTVIWQFSNQFLSSSQYFIIYFTYIVAYSHTTSQKRETVNWAMEATVEGGQEFNFINWSEEIMCFTRESYDKTGIIRSQSKFLITRFSTEVFDHNQRSDPMTVSCCLPGPLYPKLSTCLRAPGNPTNPTDHCQ